MASLILGFKRVPFFTATSSPALSTNAPPNNGEVINSTNERTAWVTATSWSDIRTSKAGPGFLIVPPLIFFTVAWPSSTRV